MKYLRNTYTVGEVLEGFVFNTLEAKGLFGLGGKLVVQPDAYWCGGLSELLKIAALASAHDVMTIPHGHSAAATLHFSLTQSPSATPMQEDLVIWNRVHQLFLRHPVTPVGGLLTPNDEPGIGMDLDLDRADAHAFVFAD